MIEKEEEEDVPGGRVRDRVPGQERRPVSSCSTRRASLIIAKLTPEGYEEIEQGQAAGADRRGVGPEGGLEPPGVRGEVRLRPQRQGDRLLLAGEGVVPSGAPKRKRGSSYARRDSRARPRPSLTLPAPTVLSLDLVPSAGYSLPIPASHPPHSRPGAAACSRLLGSPRRCCDGLTRRETLTAGALTLLGSGFTLPNLLAAESRKPADARPGKAKNVILLYLLGGAATQDMWDLKPNAPAEVRGEFKPIDTNVPRRPHLRAPAADGEVDAQGRGRPVGDAQGRAATTACRATPASSSRCRTSTRATPTRRAWGRCASGCAQDRGELPDYVYMPCWLGWGQAFRRAGPYGGFLGHRYDALTTECSPTPTPARSPSPGKPAVVRGSPLLPNTTFDADLTLDRLNTRRGLLDQLDDRLPARPNRPRPATTAPSGGRSTCSPRRGCGRRSTCRRKTRGWLDRYGRHLFGHSTLIARRLVEEGVRFVNVTWDLFWDRVQIDYDAWDTHTKNFGILQDNKLPHFDQTFTALLEDLDRTGLLDETLVVVMSEMGRTPRDQRQRRPGPLDVLLLGGVRRRRHPRRHGVRRVRRAGRLREGPAGEHGGRLLHDLPVPGHRPGADGPGPDRPPGRHRRAAGRSRTSWRRVVEQADTDPPPAADLIL